MAVYHMEVFNIGLKHDHNYCRSLLGKHNVVQNVSDFNEDPPSGPSGNVHVLNPNEGNNSTFEGNELTNSVRKFVWELQDWKFNLRKELDLTDVRQLLKQENKHYKYLRSLPLDKLFKKMKETKLRRQEKR